MKINLLNFCIALMLLCTQWMAVQNHDQMPQKPEIKRAIAFIGPSKGNTVNGTVTFEEVEK